MVGPSDLVLLLLNATHTPPGPWEGEARLSAGHSSPRTLEMGGSLPPALNNRIIAWPLIKHGSVLGRAVITLRRRKWENRGLEKSTHSSKALGGGSWEIIPGLAHSPCSSWPPTVDTDAPALDTDAPTPDSQGSLDTDQLCHQKVLLPICSWKILPTGPCFALWSRSVSLISSVTAE